MKKEISQLNYSGQDTLGICTYVVLDADVVEDGTPTFCGGKYAAFCYNVDGSLDRKFWMVPKIFKFPCVDRRNAWSFWLLGMPDHTEKKWMVLLYPILLFHFVCLTPSFCQGSEVSSTRTTGGLY